PERAGWHGMGGRYRTQPGATARTGSSGQNRRLSGQDGVLLLDDEQNRPASSGMGDGIARRGPGREPDHGRSADGSAGSVRAGPDARVAIINQARRELRDAGNNPGSESRRTPDREPSAEIRLDLQVIGQDAADLKLGGVVPAFTDLRRERVEGAA